MNYRRAFKLCEELGPDSPTVYLIAAPVYEQIKQDIPEDDAFFAFEVFNDVSKLSTRFMQLQNERKERIGVLIPGKCMVSIPQKSGGIRTKQFQDKELADENLSSE